MAESPKKNKGKNKGVGGNGNLIPAKKGEVRNPNGRPKKGTAIADILNKLLDTPKDNKTRREIILDKVLTMAENGEMAAINFIADRTEGKALERIVTQETDELIIIG